MKGTALKSVRPTLLALLVTFTLVTQARAVGYWGRMYDPNLQRWTQRDPIGERGGINLYQFVGNNPIGRVDPLGLAIGDWWDTRTWLNSGFTESWFDSANSIGQGLGGSIAWGYDAASGMFNNNWNLLKGDANFIGNAYDNGVLGQTRCGPWWAKWGTRGALGVSAVAVSAATGVGAYEFFALGNESIMVEGLIGGGEIGSGGILQLRVPGEPPIIRIDFHPISAGGNPVPHIDSPPLGWHHWPWE
jgi:hypothetical protein